MQRTFEDRVNIFIDSRVYEDLSDVILPNMDFKELEAKVTECFERVRYIMKEENMEAFDKLHQEIVAANTDLIRLGWEISYITGLKDGKKFWKLIEFI